MWYPNQPYPGTAFTRSIGDHVAEVIGVVADPEVVACTVTPLHRYLVIASDGVFEFIPSQEVIDMVAREKDIQGAAYAIVLEAYFRWLKHETRTDDITITVVEFKGVEGAQRAAAHYLMHSGTLTPAAMSTAATMATQHSGGSGAASPLPSAWPLYQPAGVQQQMTPAVHMAGGWDANATGGGAPPSASPSPGSFHGLPIPGNPLNGPALPGLLPLASTGSSPSPSPSAPLTDDDRIRLAHSLLAKRIGANAAAEAEAKRAALFRSGVFGSTNHLRNLELDEFISNPMTAFTSGSARDTAGNGSGGVLDGDDAPDMPAPSAWTAAMSTASTISMPGGPGGQHLSDSPRGSYEATPRGSFEAPRGTSQGGGAAAPVAALSRMSKQLQPASANARGAANTASAADLHALAAEASADMAPPRTPRTPAEVKTLERAVKNNFLFTHLSDSARAQVFEAMQRMDVKAGDVVIQQGSRGDHFYIVESGTFDVLVQSADGGEPHRVHTYHDRDSFGELALLYGRPRAATVVAKAHGVLWALHRKAFKSVIQVREVAPLVKTLASVQLLQCLSPCQVSLLAGMMEEVAYNEGEYIFRQGYKGDDFFVITSGQVVCTIQADGDAAPREVLAFTTGQCFGDPALLDRSARPYNAVARGRVLLMRLSRQTFEAKFGPLSALNDAFSNWSQKVASQADLFDLSNAYKAIKGRPLNLKQLEARGLLYSTDCSALMLMEHLPSREIMTLRMTSVADVTALGKQAHILRARAITRALQPSLFVPPTLSTHKDSRVLAEALATVGLCTLDALVTPGPLDEPSAKFVVASLILALEHLHYSRVVYRGLSLQTVLVAETGNLQLVDFR